MSEVFYSTSEIFDMAMNLSFANRIIQEVISFLIWSCFLVARSGYILSMRKNESFFVQIMQYALDFLDHTFFPLTKFVFQRRGASDKHEVGNCQIFLTRLSNSLIGVGWVKQFWKYFLEKSPFNVWQGIKSLFHIFL